MSGGRYQLGVGRGASPIETSFYQVDPDTSRARFNELLDNLEHLWVAKGVPFPPIVHAESFEEWHRKQGAFAGTAEGAREYVASQTEQAGVTYLAADFAFGDMSFHEASRSAELFAKEVMPAFAATPSAT